MTPSYTEPHWDAATLLLIDVQRDFVDGGALPVVVAGCNLPNCPRATLFDASQRDLRAVLVADAVSQATTERIADLETIGVQLIDVAGVEAVLGD